VTGPPGNIQVTPDTSYKSAVFYSGSKPFPVLAPQEYVTELHIAQSPRVGQYGQPVGLFLLPPVTQESHGSFFAHLPAIGVSYSGSFEPLPALISERSSSQREQLVESPLPKDLRNVPTSRYGSSDPSKYQAPLGQHFQAVYWQPASLTTTEILEDVKSEVDNASVNSIVPDGSLQGNNYVWQGKGSLEPTMSLTNQDAAASHSILTFFSGIAFGVAAGALVAFIQEDDNPLLSWLARFLSPSRQVEPDLSRRCPAHEWGPGERLPTVDELASHYRVAPSTIKKVLRHMADDGLVQFMSD